MGDTQILSSTNVKDRSVFFTNISLFMITLVVPCKSSHFQYCSIGIIQKLLTFDATAQLIHASITTRQDLCNSIRYNLPNNKNERLQQIQNQAARMLKCIPRRNHITSVLRELHLLTINNRSIFTIFFLTHKTVKNTTPEYLNDLINVKDKSTTVIVCPVNSPLYIHIAFYI